LISRLPRNWPRMSGGSLGPWVNIVTTMTPMLTSAKVLALESWTLSATVYRE
jgi:hypothetical protein